MQCHELIQHIDDWCDECLPWQLHQACARHLESCSACRPRLQAELHQREALATIAQPVPEPDQGFEARMLAAAHGAAPGRGRARSGRWSTSMVGAAMAACLVLGLMVGQFLPWEKEAAPGEGTLAQQQSPAMPEGLAAASVGPVASDTVETVRLAFSSGEAMQNVTLTLEMPAHMELASFPGERTISWQVDLEAGQNLLSLPVRNLFPGQGELVAHLDDGQRRKTFRTPVGSGDGVTGRES